MGENEWMKTNAEMLTIYYLHCKHAIVYFWFVCFSLPLCDNSVYLKLSWTFWSKSGEKKKFLPIQTCNEYY